MYRRRKIERVSSGTHSRAARDVLTSASGAVTVVGVIGFGGRFCADLLMTQKLSESLLPSSFTAQPDLGTAADNLALFAEATSKPTLALRALLLL